MAPLFQTGSTGIWLKPACPTSSYGCSPSAKATIPSWQEFPFRNGTVKSRYGPPKTTLAPQ